MVSWPLSHASSSGIKPRRSLALHSLTVLSSTYILYVCPLLVLCCTYSVFHLCVKRTIHKLITTIKRVTHVKHNGSSRDLCSVGQKPFQAPHINLTTIDIEHNSTSRRFQNVMVAPSAMHAKDPQLDLSIFFPVLSSGKPARLRNMYSQGDPLSKEVTRNGHSQLSKSNFTAQ
jgi:hypothetical protein